MKLVSMKGWCFIFSVFGLACTGLTRVGEQKSFQIKKDWVRSALASKNMTLRKLNRGSPLLYTDREKGDIVIQTNAIDGVAAYERFSGREIWRLRIKNGVESSATLNDEGLLFFGSSDGQFYSLEARTGKVVWVFPTQSENLSQPLVKQNVVYFLAGNNTVYALEAQTGKKIWSYTRQDTNLLGVRGGSRPVITDGALILGFSDGYIISLTAQTGQVKWEKQLNRNKKFRDMDTDPLVDGDFVYALGFDDRLYCLNVSSGDLVWTLEKGGYGGMLIVGDRLFYASSTGEFLAVNKLSGTKIWSYSLPEGGLATTPAFYRGLLVFGESQGGVMFLDSGTGRVVGSFDPGRGVLSPPAVDEPNNRVFFISGEANIYSLEVGFRRSALIPYLR